MPSIDAEIEKSVSDRGWHAISISDAEPPFVYTCGLPTTFHHPELVIFGLAPQTGYSVLAAMVDDLRRGVSFAQPTEYEGVLEGVRVAVRAVHPTQHELYLGYAMGHHRHMSNPGELAALQVFWPDRTGRFPFEVGCNVEIWRMQPRLDLEVTPSELRAFRRQYEG